MKTKFFTFMIVLVLMTACSGVNNPIGASTPTPTGTPNIIPVPCVTILEGETITIEQGKAVERTIANGYTAVITCNGNKVSVTYREPTPTSTVTLPPTATNTALPATATLEPACTGYTMLQETPFGHKPSDPIFKNMDVGDNQLTAVVEAWDRNDPNTAFIAIIDQVYNLDFERETIAGTYFYFSGEPAAVYCRANEMWSEMGGSAYRLYVGNHQAPAGWSTDFPSTWTMKTWVFTETTINVQGANWNAVTAQISSDHTYGSADWTYGQLWDGINASKVYPFIVAPNWKITSPKYQGTVWSINGITNLTTDTLLMRFAQMTSEVELRDDHPTVFKYYCGPENLRPSGWNTMPDGWTCIEK